MEYQFLPTFIGGDPESWISAVEEVRRTIPIDIPIEVVLRYFEGKAKRWVQANWLMISKLNWCGLVYTLLWEFGNPTESSTVYEGKLIDTGIADSVLHEWEFGEETQNKEIDGSQPIKEGSVDFEEQIDTNTKSMDGTATMEFAEEKCTVTMETQESAEENLSAKESKSLSEGSQVEEDFDAAASNGIHAETGVTKNAQQLFEELPVAMLVLPLVRGMSLNDIVVPYVNSGAFALEPYVNVGVASQNEGRKISFVRQILGKESLHDPGGILNSRHVFVEMLGGDDRDFIPTPNVVASSLIMAMTKLKPVINQYAVVHDIKVAESTPAVPWENVSLLGWGVPTGLATVWLATIEGQKTAGASRIINIDLASEYFDVAMDFGGTAFFRTKDHGDKPIHQVLVGLTDGGVDSSLGGSKIQDALLIVHDFSEKFPWTGLIQAGCCMAMGHFD